MFVYRFISYVSFYLLCTCNIMYHFIYVSIAICLSRYIYVCILCYVYRARPQLLARDIRDFRWNRHRVLIVSRRKPYFLSTSSRFHSIRSKNHEIDLFDPSPGSGRLRPAVGAPPGREEARRSGLSLPFVSLSKTLILNYIYIYIYVYMCRYVCIYIYMHAYIHIYIYIYIHVLLYAYT